MQNIEIKFIDEVGDPLDDNVDVEVRINYTTYVASFFTIKNIEKIFTQYKLTGEGSGGSYLWSSNMIIVENLEKEHLKRVISDMVSLGEVERAFEKMQ